MAAMYKVAPFCMVLALIGATYFDGLHFVNEFAELKLNTIMWVAFSCALAFIVNLSAITIA
eukprot:gene5408-6559_t